MFTNVLKTVEPSQFTIRFANRPTLVQFYDDKGRLFYYRRLDGKTSTIKVNLPEEMALHSNTQFEILRKDSLHPIELRYKLPKPDRNFSTDIKIVMGQPDKMKGSPARIYPAIGQVEVHPDTLSLPLPIQEFILFHEIGHCKYKDEFNADIYALNEFLKRGYNTSMAFYALADILRTNPANMKRIKKIFRTIQNFC